MELKLIPIEKPENLNVILGQAHFIKTVEDLHEALVTAVPGIRFGLAFLSVLGEGLYPINVLHAVKACPEVVRIYAATANPLKVVVAEEGEQRAILGVMDGFTPLGVEDEAEVAWRKDLLRRLGYKL